jgi:hypothetical protein
MIKWVGALRSYLCFFFRLLLLKFLGLLDSLCSFLVLQSVHLLDLFSVEDKCSSLSLVILDLMALLLLNGNVLRIVRNWLAFIIALTDGLDGSGGTGLVRLEQIGRLAVDLTVHDLLQTTQHNPGIHRTLLAKLRPVRIVDWLTDLPKILSPLEGVDKEPFANIAVQVLAATI